MSDIIEQTENTDINEGTEELKDILHNGLLIDVFNAETYNSVDKIISNHHKKINESDKIKRDIFSMYRQLAQDAAILSLSRVYDKPTKYKTRCILYLLKRLEEISGVLPKIEEPYQTINLLKQYHLPESCCLSVTDNDLSKFPKEIAEYYKNVYRDSSSLKDYRNKIIAHNEKLELKMTLTWQIFDELINFAIEVIEVIAMAYFGNTYRIKTEAEYKALSVEVLLNEMNL
jgi:hypothetical protein